MYDDLSLEHFMSGLKKRNPGETEFHQAVYEVVESVIPFILDNPNDVGVSSIREISAAADVSPNTLVRLAKSVGFEGYEELRGPFKEQLRGGDLGFTDRARWLQKVSQDGQLGPLYADIIHAAIDNIESTIEL